MSKALVYFVHRLSSIGEYIFQALFLTCVPHQQLLAVSSLYDGQEVLVWSDCLLDLGTDFLVSNMVFVLDA